MAHNRRNKGRAPSGAVGGPATGAGLDYQVEFAIYQALDRISRYLVNPLEDGEISMESRLVTAAGVTCWDVRLTPPDTVTEAKLKPKREEIVEWLDRIELATSQGRDSRFELFYGRGALPVLSAVERLCRIAVEANGDAARFTKLVAAERTPNVDLVLGRLKTDPQCSLLRILITPFDPVALKRDTDLLLRLLVREPARERLFQLLYQKFHKGIQQRLTYKVRSLLEDAKVAGIEFFPPQTFEAETLVPLLAGTLFILQSCESGLPEEILAAGLECSVADLRSCLSRNPDCRLLVQQDDLWAVTPFQPRLARDDGLVLLERVVRQLLEYIRANRQNKAGWRQVHNAIALAKLCRSAHPELVASLFGRLDKLLKRMGNKRLVLEVANLSLAAAHQVNRTEGQAKGEAVALVCGRSWVYQRVGRLSEARAEGEKSLKLGREIGWDRNTAFCLKCIGRIHRMEAEQSGPDSAGFRAWIQSSIDHLTQAIELFPQVTELPENDRRAEVGDCYSLLGRTYLVAQDVRQAKAAAQEATQRITDTASKDYADLQILLGDLETNKSSAEDYYDGAIRVAGTADAERSEIAARAWYRKGMRARSSQCFDAAAKIWEQLEEDENADKARWESMIVTGRVSPGAAALLDREVASVRVEAIRLHEARMASLGGGSRGRRSEPDKNYWVALLPEARRNVAVRHVEW